MGTTSQKKMNKININDEIAVLKHHGSINNWLKKGEMLTLKNITIKTMVHLSVDKMTEHEYEINMDQLIKKVKTHLNHDEAWSERTKQTLSDLRIKSGILLIRKYSSINHMAILFGKDKIHNNNIALLTQYAIDSLVDTYVNRQNLEWDAYYNDDGEEAQLNTSTFHETRKQNTSEYANTIIIEESDDRSTSSIDSIMNMRHLDTEFADYLVEVGRRLEKLNPIEWMEQIKNKLQMINMNTHRDILNHHGNINTHLQRINRTTLHKQSIKMMVNVSVDILSLGNKTIIPMMDILEGARNLLGENLEWKTKTISKLRDIWINMVVDLMESYYFINSRLRSSGLQILSLEQIESIVKVAIRKLIHNYDSSRLVSPPVQAEDIEAAHMVIDNNCKPSTLEDLSNKIHPYLYDEIDNAQVFTRREYYDYESSTDNDTDSIDHVSSKNSDDNTDNFDTKGTEDNDDNNSTVDWNNFCDHFHDNWHTLDFNEGFEQVPPEWLKGCEEVPQDWPMIGWILVGPLLSGPCF